MPEMPDEAIAVVDAGQAHSLSQTILDQLCERLKRIEGGLLSDVALGTSPGIFGAGSQPRMMDSIVLVWLRGPKQLVLVAWDVVQKTAAGFQRRPSYFGPDTSQFVEYKRRYFQKPSPP